MPLTGDLQRCAPGTPGREQENGPPSYGVGQPSTEMNDWRATSALCLACGHRWAAVHEGSPPHFECPACGEMEGVRDD